MAESRKLRPMGADPTDPPLWRKGMRQKTGIAGQAVADAFLREARRIGELIQFPPTTVGAIAERAQVSDRTVRRVLKKAEQAGLGHRTVIGGREGEGGFQGIEFSPTLPEEDEGAGDRACNPPARAGPKKKTPGLCWAPA